MLILSATMKAMVFIPNGPVRTLDMNKLLTVCLGPTFVCTSYGLRDVIQKGSKCLQKEVFVY